MYILLKEFLLKINEMKHETELEINFIPQDIKYSKRSHGMNQWDNEEKQIINKIRD